MSGVTVTGFATTYLCGTRHMAEMICDLSQRARIRVPRIVRLVAQEVPLGICRK